LRDAPGIHAQSFASRTLEEFGCEVVSAASAVGQEIVKSLLPIDEMEAALQH
jgi:hypothetical protein